MGDIKDKREVHMTIINDREILKLKIFKEKGICDPVDLNDINELTQDIRNKSLKEQKARISNTKTRKAIVNIRNKLRNRGRTIKIQLDTIYDGLELVSNSEVQKEIEKELKKIYKRNLSKT